MKAESCVVCQAPVLPVQSFAERGRVGKEYWLLECQSCHVQYWTPLEHPEAGYYETEAMGLYTTIHADTQPLDVRYRYFLSDHGRVKNLKILDIGCGNGLILQALQEQGNDVWGIDIDKKSIEIASRRGLEHVYCEDIDTFVQKAEEQGIRFDLITMFDVLEHLTHPSDTLAVLTALLTDGGKIVGTVPNRERFLRNQVKTDFPPHHFYRFNQASLRCLIQESGLAVEKVAIFEYGYTHKVIVSGLVKWLRERGNGRLSHKKIPTTTNHAPNGKKIRPVYTFLTVVRPLFALFEKATGRGFKLYFVCHQPG